MIIYIIKAVLCSAALLVIYHLFLGREKMYGFNRFYLLFSVVVSFIIPAITFETSYDAITAPASITIINNTLDAITPQKPVIPEEEHNLLPAILLTAYLVTTGILLYRFIRNVMVLFYKIKSHPLVRYSNSTIVLVNGNLVPHSFLTYIFIDKHDFENSKVEKEILKHELTHVTQKHSWDILFMEVLMVFAWFNPLLFWYKKAIQLNHEFLADETVVKTFDDVQTYQHLLLEKASRQKTLLLTSRFNYSITKKRLIMLTKTSSAKVTFIKKLALIPLVSVVAFSFCTKTIAQADMVKTSKQKQDQQRQDTPVWAVKTIGSTAEGVTPELMEEYERIVNIDKYKTSAFNWWREVEKNITPSERDRLITIFKKMSKEQQAKQFVIFIGPLKPQPKVVPAIQQFEAFKNPKKYGVWVDGRKVNNSTLNKYTNTDFDHFSVSNLYGAAKKNVSYLFQVNLMTKAYYRNYYNETITKKDMMVFQGPGHVPFTTK